MKKILTTIIVLSLATFTLVGCSGKPEKATSESLKEGLTPKSIVYDINEAIGIPMGGEIDETAAKELFHLNLEDVEEYSIMISQANISSANIAIVKAKDGKVEEVKKALEQRQQDVISQFERYLPEQLEIAQNGKVVVKGNYAILLMIDNMEEAEKIVNESFN